MSELFYGSINYDELLAAAKSGKASIKKVTKKDGSTFRAIDINVWINDKPDQFGRDGAVVVQVNEEAYKAGEKGVYIANLKKSTPTVQEASADDFNDDIDDDLPY